jgi:hypothetical protein
MRRPLSGGSRLLLEGVSVERRICHGECPSPPSLVRRSMVGRGIRTRLSTFVEVFAIDFRHL